VLQEDGGLTCHWHTRRSGDIDDYEPRGSRPGRHDQQTPCGLDVSTEGFGRSIDKTSFETKRPS